MIAELRKAYETRPIPFEEIVHDLWMQNEGCFTKAESRQDLIVNLGAHCVFLKACDAGALFVQRSELRRFDRIKNVDVASANPTVPTLHSSARDDNDPRAIETVI